MACKHFFGAKSIAADSRVSRVIWNFESPTVLDWIHAKEEELLSLSFVEFMAALRTKWLVSGWEFDIASVSSSFQGIAAFDLWCNKVREANTSLAKFPLLYIPDSHIRSHLRTHFNSELADSYRIANGESLRLDKIGELEEWITTVNSLDMALLSKHTKYSRMVLAHKAQVSAHAASLSSNSFLSSKTNASFPTPHRSLASRISPAAPISNAPRRNCPALTKEERDALMDAEGCFRCRKPFAGHLSKECTDDFPALEGYVPVTKVFCDAAHLVRDKKKTKTPVTVAAVFDAYISDDSDPIDRASSPVDQSMVEDASWYSLDSENYMDTDPSTSEYVLPHHLTWNCLVSHTSISPTPVTALIDHGAPPALLSKSFADRLNLPRRKLFKPVRVSGAFVDEGSDGHSLLDSYVKVSVLSPCAQWTSKSQVFLICPNLHTDLLLGLDFIIKNEIIVDAAHGSAIVRSSNFDLLHLPEASLSRKIKQMSPHDRRFQEKRDIKLGQDKCKRQRKLVHFELAALFAKKKARFDMEKHTTSADIVGLIRQCIDVLASLSCLTAVDIAMKKEFADCFPKDIPHVSDLPTDVYHRIEVKSDARVSVARAYSCPRKYRDGWKTLIDQHVAAGRIRPSLSPFVSPSFIIPKTDPTVLPCWVNNYRTLNRFTTPDNYPLPRVADILADCAKGSIWGKIDMMNSFFQTLVHPDDIKYTATLTPFGLWEWVVMPMGMRNSPATHQRRVTLALSELIGKICHVYLDDIIIWSNSLEEHKINVRLVLEVLRKARLYCSLKKSTLFSTEVDFLSHHISARGIEADNTKVQRILDWPTPSRAKHVRQVLGLVRYISSFLPSLAEHTAVLTPLTRIECNKLFPSWQPEHQ